MEDIDHESQPAFAVLGGWHRFDRCCHIGQLSLHSEQADLAATPRARRQIIERGSHSISSSRLQHREPFEGAFRHPMPVQRTTFAQNGAANLRLARTPGQTSSPRRIFRVRSEINEGSKHQGTRSSCDDRSGCRAAKAAIRFHPEGLSTMGKQSFTTRWRQPHQPPRRLLRITASIPTRSIIY